MGGYQLKGLGQIVMVRLSANLLIVNVDQQKKTYEMNSPRRNLKGQRLIFFRIYSGSCTGQSINEYKTIEEEACKLSAKTIQEEQLIPYEAITRKRGLIRDL